MPEGEDVFGRGRLGEVVFLDCFVGADDPAEDRLAVGVGGDRPVIFAVPPGEGDFVVLRPAARPGSLSASSWRTKSCWAAVGSVMLSPQRSVRVVLIGGSG